MTAKGGTLDGRGWSKWRPLENFEASASAGRGRLHVQLGTCAATRSSFVIETPCSKVRVEHVVVVEVVGIPEP